MEIVRHVTSNFPNRSVRIVILSGTNLGGAERCFLSLAKYMQAVQVQAWVNPWPKSCSILDGEIRRFCPYHIASNESADSTNATLKKVAGGASAVLSWGVRKLRETTAGLGVPIIDVSQNSAEWQQVVEMKRDAVLGANYLAAVSEGSVRAYPKEYRQGVRIIPNGIEADRVAPRNGREATREAWGIKPDQKVVLYLARFDGDKNPDAALAAVNKLPSNWVLVAGGSSSEQKAAFCDKSRSILEDRFRELRVTSFLGDAFAAGDVYCLPSNSEGLPLTMMECFLSRTPAVVCRWEVIEELERKHASQFCWDVPVNPGAEALAKQIVEADKANAADNVSHRQVVENAHSMAWNHYTAQNMAGQYERYILECVHDWGQRALSTDVV